MPVVVAAAAFRVSPLRVTHYRTHRVPAHLASPYNQPISFTTQAMPKCLLRLPLPLLLPELSASETRHRNASRTGDSLLSCLACVKPSILSFRSFSCSYVVRVLYSLPSYILRRQFSYSVFSTRHNPTPLGPARIGPPTEPCPLTRTSTLAVDHETA